MSKIRANRLSFIEGSQAIGAKSLDPVLCPCSRHILVLQEIFGWVEEEGNLISRFIKISSRGGGIMLETGELPGVELPFRVDRAGTPTDSLKAERFTMNCVIC